jgi:formylglycine-generating enzyme required for sulfatase activity/predicted Ser/Thr protein kinase
VTERLGEDGHVPFLGTAIMQARIERALFGAAPCEQPIRIGKYELLERLGEGATGVVYAARDPSLGRKVAIKLLRQGAAVTTADHERLVREAHVLARLSHPNIVTVFEVGETSGSLHLVMELIDGPSLEQWLEAAPAHWPELLDKFRQAGSGLSAAHKAGVIHRDFKPGNVVLGADGRVRVVDFGFARIDHPQSLATEHDRGMLPNQPGRLSVDAAGGTPAYMAPERLEGEPASQASDQYSFCRALNDALDTCSRAHPAPMQRIPKWLRDAVERGLSTDPENRWPSMEALLLQLESPKKPHLRAMAMAGVVVTGIASVQVFRETQEAALRSNDIGLLEIEVRAAESVRGQPAPALPTLRATLHPVAPDGGPSTDELEHSVANFISAKGSARTLVLEAPAGPAYLAIAREGCGSTWIPIPNFPGYAKRGAIDTIRLTLPVCPESRVGTTLIPAGEFIHSGAGVPMPLHSEYIGEEQRIHLREFLISTHEVSRGEYADYAELADLTGHAMPRLMPSRTGEPDETDLPVTHLNFYEAADYCRFLGGALPTTQQWEKALRGGLVIAGASNPMPRRNLPWGERDEPSRANLGGGTDSVPGLASTVASFPDDMSVYGVHGLAGNAREWTRSVPGGGSDGKNPWVGMRVVRGSAFDTPADAEEHFAAYENMRDPSFVAFDLGFRCVFEKED